MNPDDPKLTAYALDELDPADRAEVEALLRENPAALAEVEDTERLAAQLRRELHAEPAAPLTAEQRDEVLAVAVAGLAEPGLASEPEHGASVPVSATGVDDPGSSRRWWSRPLALAASVAVVAGATYVALLSLQQPASRSLVFEEAEMPLRQAAPDAPTWSGQDGAISPAAPASAPAQLEYQRLPGLQTMAAPPNPAPAPRGEVAGVGVKMLQDAPAPADGTTALASADVDLARRVVVGEELRGGENSRLSLAKSPAPDAEAVRFMKEREVRDVDALTTLAPRRLALAQAAETPVQRTTAGPVSATPTTHESATRLLAASPAPSASMALGLAPAKPAAAHPSAGSVALNVAGVSSGARGYPSESKVAMDSTDAITLGTEGVPVTKSTDAGVLAWADTASAKASVKTASEGTFWDKGPVDEAGLVKASKAPASAADGFGANLRGDAVAGVKLKTMDALSETPVPVERTAAGREVPPLLKAKPAVEAAVTELEAAVTADPGYADAHLDLSVALVTQQPPKTERARHHYRLAIERGAERDESLEKMLAQREQSNTESYDTITDNAFLAVRDHALSTFSIDVDTASYANVRRFLNEQKLPPKGAVRIEELLNYFDYDYPQPDGEAPFSASMEVAACPWTPEHRLVRIGLKGREIHPDKRPASNLVFLVDVSGSMQPENKLPLVKKCLRQLVDKLGGEDTVAIAVYAGASGCVLEPTNKKSEMRAALDRLESGGSTNGAAGIQLAYQLAERSFIKGGVNRVILATDGDFNVGVTNQSDLVEIIEKKAKSGVFLTVLGFGMGNLKDSTLEKLADKGNGNYAYIDTLNEGRKVLVEQMSSTLVTIAKDVKIQVEFNPAQVASYRLIGYENRMLKKEDFNDDTKDAGEIGAGHTVTALYEVVPAGLKALTPAVDGLKYQSTAEPAGAVSHLGADSRPGDAFVRAYFFAEEGRKAEESGSVEAALAKYQFASALLEQIVAKWPDWQPGIVKYRQARTADAMAAAQRKLGRATDTAKVREADTETETAQLVEKTVIERESKIQNPKSKIATELLTLKLRYKAPDGDTSKLLEFPLTDEGKSYERSSRDFRFAAAVASFGMLLRDSPHKGKANWSSTLELAIEGKGEDRSGYRAEFVGLIERAKAASR